MKEIGMPSIYVGDPEEIALTLQKSGVLDPKRWICPCATPSCRAVVLYGRHDDGRVHFIANQSFQPDPPYPVIAVSSATDLDDLSPMDGMLPGEDVAMFGLWMIVGLKDALIAAFGGD